MSSLVDERGYNQGYALTRAQVIRLRRRTDAMLAAMGAPFGREVSILELGCGTGEVAWQLSREPATQVTGLDLSPAFIREAESRHSAPNLRFVATDLIEGLRDWPEASFDFIAGNGVLHHVHADLPRVLPNLRRLLRSGGRLVFWEPNYLNPFIFLIFTFAPLRRRAQLEPSEMAFPPGFIARRLREAGLEPDVVATRDFLLPNIPSALIRPSVALGGVLEKIPLVRAWAQSLFIVARKD